MTHGETDYRRFIRNTDEDLWKCQDILAETARRRPQQYVFKAMEQAMGMHHSPAGVLQDAELRAHFLPSSANRFDPMHCHFSNGLLQHEYQLFIHAAGGLGIDWVDVHQFCSAGWIMPASPSSGRKVV